MKKTYYIIYKLIKNEGGEIVDLVNVYDSTSKIIIAEKMGLSKNDLEKHFNEYITNDLENYTTKRTKNDYIIIKDIC